MGVLQTLAFESANTQPTDTTLLPVARFAALRTAGCCCKVVHCGCRHQLCAPHWMDPAATLLGNLQAAAPCASELVTDTTGLHLLHTYWHVWFPTKIYNVWLPIRSGWGGRHSRCSVLLPSARFGLLSSGSQCTGFCAEANKFLGRHLRYKHLLADGSCDCHVRRCLLAGQLRVCVRGTASALGTVLAVLPAANHCSCRTATTACKCWCVLGCADDWFCVYTIIVLLVLLLC